MEKFSLTSERVNLSLLTSSCSSTSEDVLRFPVVLCLVGGLPASGKSSLVRALEEYTRTDSPCLAVRSIRFDDILLACATESIETVDCRPRTVNCLKSMIDGENFSMLYHRVRKEIVRRTEDEIESLLAERSSRAELMQVPFISSTYVLVEDTFEFASMRKPFARLAEKFEIGFSILWCDIPFEECLRRDSDRDENMVGEETLRNISERIESPLSVSYEREICIRVTPESPYPNKTHLLCPWIVQQIESCGIPWHRYMEERRFMELERIAARHINAQNPLVELDQRSRAYVSVILAPLSSSLQQKLGKKIASMRKTLLASGRQCRDADPSWSPFELLEDFRLQLEDLVEAEEGLVQE